MMAIVLEDDDPPEDLLEETEEDVPSILAEMEAQQAIFDVDFKEGSVDRALSLARHALDLKAPPSTMESRLTIVALSHCLGIPRTDLALVPPTSEGPWVQRAFEILASGWMRWLLLQDKTVLQDIIHLGGEDDAAGETLSLNFWARAIELLAQGQKSDAKKFFERSTEVGSQFGTRTNPLICWSYAASFFPTSKS
jgi:hypothetical protein